MAGYANISQIRDAIENKWITNKNEIDGWKSSLVSNEKKYKILAKNVEMFNRALGNVDVSVSDAKFTNDYLAHQEELKTKIQQATDDFGGQEAEEREFYRFKHGLNTQKSSNNSIQMLLNAINFADKGHDFKQALECLKIIINGAGVDEKYVHQASHLMQVIELDDQLEIITSDVERLKSDNYKEGQEDISRRIREVKESFLKEGLPYADEVEYEVSKEQINDRFKSLERYLKERVSRIESDIKSEEDARARERERQEREAEREKENRAKARREYRIQSRPRRIATCCAIAAVLALVGLNLKTWHYIAPPVSFATKIVLKNPIQKDIKIVAPKLRELRIIDGTISSVNVETSGEIFIDGNTQAVDGEITISKDAGEVTFWGTDVSTINIEGSVDTVTVFQCKVESVNLKKYVRNLEISEEWDSVGKLSELNLPDGIKVVSLTSLPIKNISIPESVDSFTLDNDDEIDELYIPSNLSSIDIKNCDSLRKLTVISKPPYDLLQISGESIEEVIVPEGVKSIIDEYGRVSIENIN